MAHRAALGGQEEEKGRRKPLCSALQIFDFEYALVAVIMCKANMFSLRAKFVLITQCYFCKCQLQPRSVLVALGPGRRLGVLCSLSITSINLFNMLAVAMTAKAMKSLRGSAGAAVLYA